MHEIPLNGETKTKSTYEDKNPSTPNFVSACFISVEHTEHGEIVSRTEKLPYMWGGSEFLAEIAGESQFSYWNSCFLADYSQRHDQIEQRCCWKASWWEIWREHRAAGFTAVQTV